MNPVKNNFLSKKNNNDVDTTKHESSEKQLSLQKKKKHDLALKSWKWNEVIDLESSDNQHQLTDEDVDTTDTTENLLDSTVHMNQPIQGEDDAPHQAEDDVGVIQPNPVENDVCHPTRADVAWPDEE
ncbi:unnamed protein product [Lactuca virosa]|uniref:Uncharacterized protein n=1 Tax=Lactuca virosa TaxID=75947 RepID=A0AAU9M172_9ASTR|nr:unnamed protein product [Lactuca virosa]